MGFFGLNSQIEFSIPSRLGVGRRMKTLPACILDWAAAEARSRARGYAILLTFVRPVMLTVLKCRLYILIPSPQPLLTNAMLIMTLKMWHVYK